jgi:hypothetical protein
MIEYFVVSLAALFVAALTLFSGFGLGTILMPVLALFFPIPVAIAATAIVHLANNIFKVVLVGRKADWGVVVRFAIPGAFAAILGALLLELFTDTQPLMTYVVGGANLAITPVGIVIGSVIIAFALLDLLPRFKDLAFDKKYLPTGGLLSGFFGGLSGNQGALRSAFLIKTGLDKEAFIGTGTISAIIVDFARLSIYGLAFYSVQFTTLPSDLFGLVITAMISAFVGSFIGSRLIKKVTIRSIQVLVGIMLVIVGVGLAVGLI